MSYLSYIINYLYMCICTILLFSILKIQIYMLKKTGTRYLYTYVPSSIIHNNGQKMEVLHSSTDE